MWPLSPLFSPLAHSSFQPSFFYCLCLKRVARQPLFHSFHHTHPSRTPSHTPPSHAHIIIHPHAGLIPIHPSLRPIIISEGYIILPVASNPNIPIEDSSVLPIFIPIFFIPNHNKDTAKKTTNGGPPFSLFSSLLPSFTLSDVVQELGQRVCSYKL